MFTFTVKVSNRHPFNFFIICYCICCIVRNFIRPTTLGARGFSCAVSGFGQVLDPVYMEWETSV